MDAMKFENKNSNYYLSNKEKYLKITTKEHFDKFIEMLKKHEQENKLTICNKANL